MLTGATLGEKDTSLEEMEEGIVVDTTSSAETSRERQGRARRSALQELDDDDDGGEEAAGAAADAGTFPARSVVGPDVSALLFDPDDDIDDI